MMLTRSLAKQSTCSVPHKCRNINNKFSSQIFKSHHKHWFLKQSISVFESRDVSATPRYVNWKSEMRFDHSFSDGMSNFFLEVFVQKDLNWLEFTCVNKLVLERARITRINYLGLINSEYMPKLNFTHCM